MGTLSMRGVRKTYGKTVALESMDLDIGDGEFFVILGPSGAGKTTTLKSIAGLVDIDAGQVSINGVDMTGVEPYHRNVAMAFESYALYPQKTVAQNLASPLKSGRSGSFSDADQKQRIDTVTTTLGSTTSSSDCRGSCRTVSVSAPRSAGCSCAPPTSTCSMSR